MPRNHKRVFLLGVLASLGSVVIGMALSSPGQSQGAGPAGYIATFAGGGVGDGQIPTSATLVSSGGLAVASDGSLLAADGTGCRVRRISESTINTVAGNGYCGFSGDGGPAEAARLGGPNGVAVAPNGDFYIADRANCRIRFVSGGTIQTAAGTGVCASGPDSGPALSVNLRPNLIAVDGNGDLLITDECRLRKLSSGTITTIAGTGTCGALGDGGPATSAQLGALTGVTVDANGDIYVSQSVYCRVRRISSGMIYAFAGNGTCGTALGDGGPATDAQVFLPGPLTTDRQERYTSPSGPTTVCGRLRTASSRPSPAKAHLRPVQTETAARRLTRASMSPMASRWTRPEPCTSMRAIAAGFAPS